MFPRRKQSHSWILEACPLPSTDHRRRAQQRQDVLTKPQGSLGTLETIAITLAGLQSSDKPCATRVPIVVFAGDHGIAQQGVSAYPSAVTVEMLKNFSSGGAAIAVLARHQGCSLTVVDAGSAAEAAIPGIIWDKPRKGTRDFSQARAISDDELTSAFNVGQKITNRVLREGADVIAFGEMGIGNTTSATAVACAILKRDPVELVGAGTGLNAEQINHKARIVARALAMHTLSGKGDVWVENILACVGGLEIAALIGGIVTAAQARIPILIDGFIVSVAALAAVRLNASCRNWLLFSHRSSERGHSIVLEALAAQPILDLNLRLGEGSGAAVALSIVRLACQLHNEMATFAEASVSGPSLQS